MHNVQKKLYRAYGKVAKKLGERYEVFRPEPFNLELGDDNYVDTKYVSVSNDNQYNTNPAPFKASMWKLWIDGRLDEHFDIQRGDYLINQETGRCFFVSFSELNVPLECVECNGQIDIATVEAADYQDQASGWGMNYDADGVDVARNLPAYVGAVGSASIDGGFIPARTSHEQAHNTYEIYFWLPEGLVSNGSIITHGSVQISAQQVFYGPAGYKVIGVAVQ